MSKSLRGSAILSSSLPLTKLFYSHKDRALKIVHKIINWIWNKARHLQSSATALRLFSGRHLYSTNFPVAKCFNRLDVVIIEIYALINRSAWFVRGPAIKPIESNKMVWIVSFDDFSYAARVKRIELLGVTPGSVTSPYCFYHVPATIYGETSETRGTKSRRCLFGDTMPWTVQCRTIDR